MKFSSDDESKRAAFSLIELLGVISIFVILAAILIPILSKVRETAQLAKCTSHLHNLHELTLLYVTDNGGLLPAPKAKSPPTDEYWRRGILPYLSLGSNDDDVYKTESLVCPVIQELMMNSDRTLPLEKRNISSYAFNQSLSSDDGTGYERLLIASVRDPSSTMLATEGFIKTTGTPIPLSYITPDQVKEYTAMGQGNCHGGKQNILFIDGHIELFEDIIRISQAPYLPGGAQDIWTY